MELTWADEDPSVNFVSVFRPSIDTDTLPAVDLVRRGAPRQFRQSTWPGSTPVDGGPREPNLLVAGAGRRL